jgi:ring-1,2-phenylacetyl-CoA epoxidase subunit PaaD
VPLTLQPIRHIVVCPQCGSDDTRRTSDFGSTACKAQHRCGSCDEPFESVKEI